ncbi:MAG: ATP-binding protein [Deinococcus sp.]|nr:ATP-binding protein [Deinococcus sp.]
MPDQPLRFAAAAFDALSAHIAILDEEGVIVLENRMWQRFSCDNGGIQTLGSNYLRICEGATGDDAASAHATARGIRQVLGGQTSLYELEYPCHSPTEERYFAVRITAFEQGGRKYALVAHENITRRKQAELEVRRLNQELEQRVLERTEQLARSNRELARLTQVASHDLQEPLRIISSYSDLLSRRFSDQLSDRGSNYLQHIQHHTGRARSLVRALLELSSISAPQALQRVDLAEQWAAAWHDLPPETAAQIRVRVEALPRVQGDPEQLRLVLTQLLDNAVQFRAERPLHLHVLTRDTEEAHLVQIGLRDNGSGLPQGHGSEEAFGMFRRLHVAGVAGQGTGLAICEKVMQFHGGEIWLEPNASGGGITVWMTLPRWQDAPQGRSRAKPAGAAGWG